MKYKVLRTTSEKLEADLGQAYLDGYKPISFMPKDNSISPYEIVLEQLDQPKIFVPRGSGVSFDEYTETVQIMDATREADDAWYEAVHARPKTKSYGTTTTGTAMTRAQKTIFAWLILAGMALVLFITHK